MGLQFENLVLNNIVALAPLIGLTGKNVESAAPYFRSGRKTGEGVQIDYLVQLPRCTYIVEIKRKNRIGNLRFEVNLNWHSQCGDSTVSSAPRGREWNCKLLIHAREGASDTVGSAKGSSTPPRRCGSAAPLSCHAAGCCGYGETLLMYIYT